ncbi:MAG TPA: GDSL-type esterase/lipase family protein [Flavobacterium sp.]|jgi:lysophospholipase L1-like esterase
MNSQHLFNSGDDENWQPLGKFYQAVYLRPRVPTTDYLFSGTSVTRLNDQTGHGNHYPVTAGNPTIGPESINGKPTLNLKTSDILMQNSAIVGLTNQNERAGYMVFKLMDVTGNNTFQAILLMGNIQAGTLLFQVCNTNNTNEFAFNYSNAALITPILKPQLHVHYFEFIKTLINHGVGMDGSPLIYKTGAQDIGNPATSNTIIGRTSAGFLSRLLLCELCITNPADYTESIRQKVQRYIFREYGKRNTNIALSKVLNRGIGNDGTKQVIARLATLKADLPKITALNIGTNDTNIGDATRYTTPAEYKANLHTIANEMESVGSVVIAISFLPSLSDPNSGAAHYAKFLEFIAERPGIIWWDLRNAINTAPNRAACFQGDGIHLTDAGTTVYAEGFFNGCIVPNKLQSVIWQCLGDSNTAGHLLPGDGQLNATGQTWPGKLKTLLTAYQ